MINLLIVDDNEDHRKLLAAVVDVTAKGVETKILEAATLAEAREITARGSIDLTFIDLNLPDCTIDDVLQAIDTFHPPVIVCSGMPMHTVRAGRDIAILGEAIEAGADYYIEKGSVAFQDAQRIWIEIALRKNRHLIRTSHGR